MKHSRSAGQRVGISHFPLTQEDRTQQAVPPRGQAKQGGREGTPAPRKLRKPILEEGSVTQEAGAKLGAKSGKGGKSGGSRAGLLAGGRNTRGRKTRGRHPLDLL